MTPGRVRGYAEAVRERYFLAAKKEKGRIMDEFTKVTSHHRKAAIRLFRHGNQSTTSRKRGCSQRYGLTVASALRAAWEATDRLCSKRLCPFLPELVMVLRRHGESAMTADIEAQLSQMSPSTIDRLLRPYRRPIKEKNQNS